MTIHHDKLAYGKLAPNMEELSEEEILKMLETLSEEEGETLSRHCEAAEVRRGNPEEK